MTGGFSIECRQGPGFVHVIPKGELDLATAPALDQVLDEEQARSRNLVLLDLRRLTFLDSTGVHILLRAQERALTGGSELTIVRGSCQVQRALEVAGLERHLPLVDEPPAELGES